MKMEPASGALDYGIVVEKDVDVPMRDGAHLKADVFRPDAPGAFPAILNLGPYQKDKLWIPPSNLGEDPNPLMNWETVNPQWWVPKGYAAVRVDGRGAVNPPGSANRGRSRSRSTFTMRSSGRRRSRGARARSDYQAYPISLSTSGSSPTTSRRR